MPIISTEPDTRHWHSAGYWRARAPDLHVEDADWWAQQGGLPLDPSRLGECRTTMLREGYVQLEPVAWTLPIDAMATLVGDLRAAGLPPVLAWLYDEFWAAHRQLLPLSTALLAGPVAALPNFWTWCIEPREAESGWQPHRDLGRRALFADGTPKVLSFWLPLTHATPLNGCMYLVPADRDPTYNTADEMSLRFAFQDVRALPARAGSILAWNQAVVHWGSHASPRARTPRISLGIEHQRADLAPFTEPLRDPAALPSLGERLDLIGRQLERYAKFHPDEPALLRLGRALQG